MEKLLVSVEQGSDLKPWQSSIPWISVGTWRDDNDSLLRAWAIWHFHLGDTLGRDGFMSRTNELLFAHVTDTAFYAIAVMKHSAWSKQILFDTLRANWPEISAPYEVHGVRPSIGFTEQDLAKMRRGNINVLTAAEDGTTYAPLGWGKTTAGTSLSATIFCDRASDQIRNLERQLKETPSVLVEGAAKKGVALASAIDLQLIVEGNWLVARDTGTGVRFQLAELL